METELHSRRLGRYLDRVKIAFRGSRTSALGQHSGTASLTVAQSPPPPPSTTEPSSQHPAATTAAARPHARAANASFTIRRDSCDARPRQAPPDNRISPDRGPSATDSAQTIEADAEDDNGETSDTRPPSPLLLLPSRAGVREQRAQRLLERCDLTTHRPRARTSQGRRPNKIRRVERPVRIRVHWVCHECSSTFAEHNTCTTCGHHRCDACSRHPPRRVKRAMEDSTEPREQERRLHSGCNTAAVVAGASDDSRRTRVTNDVVVGRALVSPPEFRPLEADDDDDGENVPPSLDLAVYTRPCSAVSLVHKSKSQIIRRECHRCAAPLLPANKAECEKCGHVPCVRCPRSARTSKWFHGPSGDAQPERRPEADDDPAGPFAVQRVVKLPRQRVHYICDQCDAAFANTNTCNECGHHRCPSCSRQPPKRGNSPAADDDDANEDDVNEDELVDPRSDADATVASPLPSASTTAVR